MGEGFLRRQAHGFKHQRCRAYENYDRPLLTDLLRRDEFLDSFCVELRNGPELAEGDYVLAFATEVGAIAVARGLDVIGFVTAECVDLVREILRVGKGIARFRVEDVLPGSACTMILAEGESP